MYYQVWTSLDVSVVTNSLRAELTPKYIHIFSAALLFLNSQKAKSFNKIYIFERYGYVEVRTPFERGNRFISLKNP